MSIDFFERVAMGMLGSEPMQIAGSRMREIPMKIVMMSLLLRFLTIVSLRFTGS